jgi:membrane complex biogenesis BtpA family protein
VLRDAQSLAEAEFPALMLENFGDAPFFPGRAPAVTTACLARLAVEIRSRFDLPLGINVLRNDGRTALAIAVACGAAFIRVNVLTGARVADQGILQGIAHRLLRDRAALHARGIAILADVDVKHSAPLAPRALGEETADMVERGGADGVIVSGGRTGSAVDLDKLRLVRSAASGRPVLVGSGTSPDFIAESAALADGWIVGSWMKRDGCASNPVDPGRARDVVAAYLQSRPQPALPPR